MDAPREGRVAADAAKAYLEQRIEPQMAWYNARAISAKRAHYLLASVQFIATAAIPVANVALRSTTISTMLAALASIAASFAYLARHQENWINYRQTAGALETLRLRYTLGLPPFDGADRNDLLIEEGDRILGEETVQWSRAARQSDRAPSLLGAFGEATRRD